MGEFWYRSGSLSLDSTVVMGILNVTPDSFSDGGRYASPEKALEHALEMQAQGAGILDVGAQSTRPGHVPISPEEEWARLEPVLDRLRGRIRIPISVDTYYPSVAKAALVSGADILNDVSGDLHNGMMELAAETGAGLVVMHAGGGADDVGAAGADVVETVRRFFEKALARAAEAGLGRNRLCLDPGIGFGKTREGDRRLVSSLPRLMQGLPDMAVLVGASDRLEDTVNYSRVAKRVLALMQEQKDDLIERAATRIAEGILADFPVEGVTVCLKKPRAPIAADFAYVAVEITRWRSL